MTLYLLDPRLQHYAWGDTRFLPKLLGTENPDERPFAELWLGAHPELPSRVGERTLRDIVSEDPESVLGEDVARSFGGELPYLIKVLSAAKPLSVQAHPNEEQAREGYARENAADLSAGARQRSYRDPRGKPELLAALTDFYALVGFRPHEEIAAVLDDVPELHRFAQDYEPGEPALRRLYDRLMSLPQNEVDRVLDPILVRLKGRKFDRERREFWLVRCDELFSRGGSRDRGLFSLLLLNFVHLQPGEALFLEPGTLHAYLEGAGVEIMASSDNVVRGGLTDKHVDLSELSRILRFNAGKPRILRANRRSEGVLAYETTAKEFELRILEVSAERPYRTEGAASAEILVVLSSRGEMEIASPRGSLRLGRGGAAFVSAGTSYELRGSGTVYVAAVPDRAPRFRGRRPKELRFGTSGLRGLVAEMTDLEAYVNTRGFIDYLLDRREIYRGDPVSIAGDLRPSTERLLRSVARAIEDAGFRVQNLGRIPTPALVRDGMSKGRASIMVTGSHIPFDRNGIKFHRPTGEVLKEDEEGILRAVARARSVEYERPEPESPFEEDGMVREGRIRELSPPVATGRNGYLRRYADFFPEEYLAGKRIVLYQHSAVGRDLLVELLRGFGADVLPMGRSDSFIPIDTENVSDERLSELQRLAAVAKDTIGTIDAIVSTDGDSDRPLVVGLTPEGSVRFAGGELLGTLAAEYLQADAVAVPVSVNDAVDLWFEERGVRLKKTRIGSPYVIEGMRALRDEGAFARIVGFEANGGFLTETDIERKGRKLAALPTRDAALPILAVLHQTVEQGCSLLELFERLPRRFGKAGLLDESSVKASRALLRRFATEEGLRELRSYFTPALGFGAIVGSDTTDGLRLRFEGGDIAHIRPSGNAPQLRIYAVADTERRADEIVRLALAEPDGILRKLERAATESTDSTEAIGG